VCVENLDHFLLAPPPLQLWEKKRLGEEVCPRVWRAEALRLMSRMWSVEMGRLVVVVAGRVMTH
jgi:hypothetical protein